MGDAKPVNSINSSATLVNFVRPTFGYMIVAACCFFAGFRLQNPVGFGKIHLYELISFCLLVVPYHINRNILEHPSNYGPILSQNPIFINWLRKMAIQLPLLLIVLSAINVIFAPISDESSRGIISRFCIAIVPFVIYSVWITIKWSDKVCFLFRYRSFFPALLTCGLPFLVGWFISKADYWGLILFNVIILGFWGVSLIPVLFDRPYILWLIGLMLLVILVVFSILLSGTEISIISKMWYFAILITMVMGISESWRITKLELSRENDYIENGIKFQSGTNIASSIFPAFFILTILHPNTTNLYSILIFIFLFTQFSIWLMFRDKFNYQAWNIIGVLFGLAFPLLIAFGVSLEKAIEFSFTIYEGNLIRALFAGFSFTLILLFGGFLYNIIKGKGGFPSFLTEFRRTRPCLALAGIIMSFFNLICCLFLFLPGLSEATSDTAKKLAIIVTFYMAFSIFLGVSYAIHWAVIKTKTS